MDTLYLPAATDSYLDTALKTLLQIHAHEPRGDILTFLTGQDEIQALERLIPERSASAVFPASCRCCTLPHQALVLADGLICTLPGQGTSRAWMQLICWSCPFMRHCRLSSRQRCLNLLHPANGRCIRLEALSTPQAVPNAVLAQESPNSKNWKT